MEKEYAKYLLNKTEKDYNLIAEDFSSKRGKMWEEFKFLKDYASSEDKILDLGCGNGRLIELFQGKNIEYYGIDNSKELIEIAKKRYSYGKFQVADALGIPFPMNFFNKVISIAVLHHIPSEELRLQFLKEAKRVLKSKGFFVVTIWDLLQRRTSWKLLFKYTLLKIIGKSKLDFGDIFVPWKISQEKDAQRYFHCFTKRELKRIVQGVGFKVLQIKSLKRSARHYNILLIAEKP